jgi:hypothetical protein
VSGEAAGERLSWVRRLAGFPAQPALVDGEGFTLANDDGTLDDVLELPGVAGPAVAPENLERVLVDVLDRLPDLPRVTVDEVCSGAGRPSVDRIDGVSVAG